MLLDKDALDNSSLTELCVNVPMDKEFMLKNKNKLKFGVIFLGNIAQDNMDEYQNMFSELPSLFQESALVDRIHGFIKGWDIPRMNDDLKLSGWALNSEYFCSIMHELRNDMSYRAIGEKIVDVPERSDTRDTEAIKRIAKNW